MHEFKGSSFTAAMTKIQGSAHRRSLQVWSEVLIPLIAAIIQYGLRFVGSRRPGFVASSALAKGSLLIVIYAPTQTCGRFHWPQELCPSDSDGP